MQLPNTKKGREMVKKTIKKSNTATKRVVAKNQPVDAPKHECNCGNHCCCCHGGGFFGILIKIIILCMVFLLGCISAPWLMRNPHKHMMNHIKFDDNGCVVLDSIKCPKLLESLATADDNADGCISKMELRNAMSEMHHGAPLPEPTDM